MTKQELLNKLVADIQAGRLKSLAIYGHGASGKSTFTKELCQRLDASQFNLLETDPCNRHEKSKKALFKAFCL